MTRSLSIVFFLALIAVHPSAPRIVAQENGDTPLTLGKDGLKLEGNVAAGDPRVKVVVSPTQSGALPAKRFMVNLEEGKRYEITMSSTALDSFLVVQDAKGKQLAFDDDSGGGLDARLVFEAPATAAYRVFAASLKGTGAFTLRVRELPRGKPGDAAKPIEHDVAKDGLLTLEGKLAADDPRVTVMRSQTQSMAMVAQRFLVKMETGKRYDITLRSRTNDSFLLIRNSAGRQLMVDDDTGGGLDASLEFPAFQGGIFEVHAGTLKGFGPFRLTIRELKGDGKLTLKERFELSSKRSTLNRQAVEAHAKGSHTDATDWGRQAWSLAKQLYPTDDYPDGHAVVAAAMNNLAHFLESQKKLDEAEPLFRDALAMKRRVFQGDHVHIAEGCYSLGYLLNTRGRFAEAEPLYRESVEMFKRLSSEDSPALARSLTSLGVIWLKLQRHDDAETPLREALAMRRRLSEQDRPDLAESLHNMARVLMVRSKFDDAEPYCRDYLAMAKRLSRGDNPLLAEAINEMATLRRHQGRFREAEALARDELEMHRRMVRGDHESVARSMSNLAVVLMQQGKHVEAEPVVLDAFAMMKRLYKGDHPNLATAMNNVASLLRDVGKFAEAEAILRDALATWRRLQPNDHPAVALALHNLSETLRKQGKLTEAEPLIRDAVAMKSRLYKGDHYDLARSMSELGTFLLDADRIAEAQPVTRDVLAMRRRLYKGDHPEIAIAENDVAAVLWRLGDPREAERHFRVALEMNQRLSPQGSQPTARDMEWLARVLADQGKTEEAFDILRASSVLQRLLHLTDHPDLLRSEFNLGVTLFTRGDAKNAEPCFRDALAMGRRMLEVQAALKSEGDALTFWSRLPPVRDGFLTLARAARLDPESVYAEIWMSKGILTRVYERRALAARAAALDPAAANLLQDRSKVRVRRAEILMEKMPANADERKARDLELKSLDDRAAELERMLRPLIPSISRSDKLDKAQPADLRALLSDDVAVVDYLGYTHYTSDKNRPGLEFVTRTPKYLAFIITKDKVDCVDLGAEKDVDDSIHRWREAIVQSKSDIPAELGRDVRERVWDKVRACLPKGLKAVYIAPDLALTGIPWSALPGDRKDSVLIEDCAVAIIPHAPFLLDQLGSEDAAPKRQGNILVVGGVAFDDSPNLDVPPDMSASRTAPLVAGSGGWKSLQGAAAEARGLHALATTMKKDNTLLTDSKASAQAVLRELPKARLAHLATHGFFADAKFRSVFQVDPKLFETRGLERVGSGTLSPMVLSGLVFAGANRADTPGRGLVTGEALVDRDLSGLELAVLSACETGLGDVAGGEGIFGLQRAFHLAGTRNLIASLWKVEDNATAALMAIFYRELWQNNQSPLEALRRAQLEIYRNPGRIPELAKGWRSGFELVPGDGPAPAIDSRGRAHPRQWAAFQLSGTGTSLTPDSARKTR
jgi:CHAT domain-containing protein/tetratricopeptide (TPR) repeat protein